MKLVVGLGNPGAQYEKTRHNAGFMVVDALADRHAGGMIPKSRFHAVTLDAMIGGQKCLLIKPGAYMNRSGQSVGEALRFFKLDPGEDLIVIVDDTALPVGSIRIRGSGGAGGHNGLADIDRALGGAAYPRLRVGVGEVPRLMDQADWVLSRFMDEEKPALRDAIDASCDATQHILEHGVTSAMNAFNKKIEKPGRREHPNDDAPEPDSNERTHDDPGVSRDAG